MNPITIITKTRNGEALSEKEIGYLVRGFLKGELEQYQLSAWLMAVYLNGITPEETAALTKEMTESGDVLCFDDLPGAKVDKHSTGGVGDLVSIPLAPLVAACGVWVPMISGRGLGHTGGTLDKLESLKGLRTRLDPEEFKAVLKNAGFVMGGQSDSIAPMDRHMYALRDVTGTVESIPLITSSILSKKLAEGIDALVLDVKFGRGAFMKTEESALELAGELTRVSGLNGVPAVAFVTAMDSPLGTAVGNALELASSLDCLQGRGPADLQELITVLGSAMLCLGGVADNWQQAQDKLRRAMETGAGLERFKLMAAAQGGDIEMIDRPETLPAAPLKTDVVCRQSGYVERIDALRIGRIVAAMGGGRVKVEDAVDSSVGLTLAGKPGDAVQSGDVLATLHHRSESRAEAWAEEVHNAYKLVPSPPDSAPLVRWLVTSQGAVPWGGAETWDTWFTANRD